MGNRYPLFSTKKILIYVDGFIVTTLILISYLFIHSDWVFCALPLALPIFILGARGKRQIAEMENGKIRITLNGVVQSEFDLDAVHNWHLEIARESALLGQRDKLIRKIFLAWRSASLTEAP